MRIHIVRPKEGGGEKTRENKKEKDRGRGQHCVSALSRFRRRRVRYFNGVVPFFYLLTCTVASENDVEEEEESDLPTGNRRATPNFKEKFRESFSRYLTSFRESIAPVPNYDFLDLTFIFRT